MSVVARANRLLVVAVLALFSASAYAQSETPVYLEDSPRAAEALSRVRSLAAGGLYDEASRVIQNILADQAGRVLRADPEDDAPEAVYVSVRTRALQLLRETPPLLSRYRELHEPRAAALLATGDVATVERTLVLTPSGYEAALRTAERRYEQARFVAAWDTLAQLEGHPDARGARLDDLLTLAESVAAYLKATTDASAPWLNVERLLATWRTQANAQPVAAAEPGEAPRTPDFTPARAILDGFPRARLDSVLPSPIASREFGERLLWVQSESTPSGARRGARRERPRGARVLHAAPVVAGDTVLINDSETISAWHRFTGARLWSYRVEPAPRSFGRFRSRRAPGFLEPSTLAVRDPIAVALTGRRGEPDDQERQLVALDIRTGDVRWTALMSRQLDEALRDVELAGPPVIDQDIVIVAGERTAQSQRTAVALLLGFDLASGELLWTRTQGSTGLVPYQMTGGNNAGAPLARAGRVFHLSNVGVLSCVESATGRVVWTRPFALNRAGFLSAEDPWTIRQPTLAGEHLIVIAPDTRSIHRFDAATGEQIEQVQAIRWDRPQYFLHHEGVVLGIDGTRVVAKPAERFADEDALAILWPPAERDETTNVLGRVLVAGDELVIPTRDGLEIIALPSAGALATGDWEQPTPRRVPLDEPGVALVADGQVIVASDQRLHLYLSWPVAETLLRARIVEQPTNPAPATTFAELAYRAGKPGEIIPSVDAAITALKADPISPQYDPERQRLLFTILRMVEPNRTGTRDAQLDVEQRDELLRRLDFLAATPEERAMAAIVAGRYFETTQRYSEAADRYQRVLLDDQLAGARYDAGPVGASAGSAAERRLRRVVAEVGRAVYAEYERRARSAFEALGPDPDPVDLARVARRYPVAIAASKAYLSAADAFERRGDGRRALSMLEAGLDAALPGDDPERVGEFAGRLIIHLLEQQRPISAAGRFQQTLRDWPDVALTLEGRPIDPRRLEDAVRAMRDRRPPRPAIGPEVVSARLIPGYTFALPLSPADRDAPADAVILRDLGGDLSYWRIDDDGLSEVWSGVENAALIRHDHRGIYVTRETPRDEPERLVIERLDPGSGATIWRLDADRALADAQGDEPPVAPGVSTRIFGGSTITAFADNALVLLNRTGAATAVDLDTGSVLWGRRLAVHRVWDAAAGQGVLAVAGLRSLTPEEARARKNQQVEDLILALDLVTGRPLARRFEKTPVRWTRVSPEGHIVYGTEQAVASIDAGAAAAEQRWRLPIDASDHLDLTSWAGPGVVIIPRSEGLFVIDTLEREPQLRPVPDTARDGASLFGFIDYTQLADERFAVATEQGVTIVDNKANVLGADLRSPELPIVRPAWGEDVFYVLSAQGDAPEARVAMIGRRGVPVERAHTLWAFDTATAKPLSQPVAVPLMADLDLRPSRAIGVSRPLIARDGFLLIGTITGVVALETPTDTITATSDAPFDRADLFASPAPATPTPDAADRP